MPRGNGITRQEILAAIKTDGAMTAEELSQKLQISPVAVRQHLTSLESEGTVGVRVERRGLGRPSHRYHLTEAGDEGFLRRYDLLAIQLLDDLKAAQGEAAVVELTETRQRSLRQSLGEPAGERSLGVRVQELAKFETERGFMAEVQPAGDQEFLLTKRNCTVCSVAKKYPSVCCGGQEKVYAEILGQAKVTLERTVIDGDPLCVFRVRNASSVERFSPSEAVVEARADGYRNKETSRSVLEEEAAVH